MSATPEPSQITENSIISEFQRSFPLLQSQDMGIGDDAAVLSINETLSWVISKDILAENVHFRRRYYSPEAIAHKLLHTNLSDIAAMGAIPCYCLLGISIPPDLDKAWSDRFCEGFSEACARAHVQLIGGDTTRSQQGLFCSLTVIGASPPHHIKFRSEAQADDVICVTGSLGNARAGLMVLEKELNGFDTLKNAQRTPQAAIAEGIWLGTSPAIHAMMDLSDGLHLDLQRLCRASNVGATIQVEKLPLSHEFIAACEMLSLNPQITSIEGGEDYRLLCTVAKENFPRVAESYYQQFKHELTPIGKIVPEQTVKYYWGTEPYEVALRPFQHF